MVEWLEVFTVTPSDLDSIPGPSNFETRKIQSPFGVGVKV